MKILFIVHRFHTNLYFPTKALLEAGHNVTLIVPDDPIHSTVPEDRSYVIPMRLRNDQITVSNVRSILRAEAPDLVIQRHFPGRWVLFSIIAKLMCIPRITYDQSPQNGDDALKQLTRPLRRVIRGRPLRKFTPVIHRGKDGKYSEPFSRYVPFPIEPEIGASTREYTPAGMVRFLCVGKLGQQRKRHLLLLDALEGVQGEFSIKFVGAGERFPLSDTIYMDKLKERCENSTWGHRVTIVKDLPYREMRNLYLQHDVLVMPAVQEPHGQCILEALASGCPVISSDDCGASGEIVSGYNGFVFKKDELDSLKEKLIYFIENPTEIPKFGSNALDRILHLHTSQNFAEQLCH